MSDTAEEVADLRQFEIIDHNIAAGYVTYIVDLWDGVRKDPAVSITRYIGVWREEKLEKEDGEAFDPSFWAPKTSRYSYRNNPVPEPLAWERIEVVRAADQELLRFKSEQALELGEGDSYLYGSRRNRVELYKKFMDAIDTLANNPDDEAAWQDVEQYRNYNARLHEK